MKMLNSSDYYWAFTLSEIMFLVFGLLSRLYDQNMVVPAILFMLLGILFAIKAYDCEHPGIFNKEMGDH